MRATQPPPDSFLSAWAAQANDGNAPEARAALQDEEDSNELPVEEEIKESSELFDMSENSSLFDHEEKKEAVQETPPPTGYVPCFGAPDVSPF